MSADRRECGLSWGAWETRRPFRACQLRRLALAWRSSAPDGHKIWGEGLFHAMRRLRQALWGHRAGVGLWGGNQGEEGELSPHAPRGGFSSLPARL